MAGKKPIVKIRVYRGTELNYDANGKSKNENYVISMEHNSKIWGLFKRNLKLNGYCKAELESVWIEKEQGIYNEVKDVKEYEDELKEAFSNNVKEVLTPEQKKIAELEAKLEAFMNQGKEKVEVIATEKSIEEVRAEYEEVVGKKPHHMAKIETLIKEIEENK